MVFCKKKYTSLSPTWAGGREYREGGRENKAPHTLVAEGLIHKYLTASYTSSLRSHALVP